MCVGRIGSQLGRTDLHIGLIGCKWKWSRRALPLHESTGHQRKDISNTASLGGVIIVVVTVMSHSTVNKCL